MYFINGFVLGTLKSYFQTVKKKQTKFIQFIQVHVCFTKN